MNLSDLQNSPFSPQQWKKRRQGWWYWKRASARHHHNGQKNRKVSVCSRPRKAKHAFTQLLFAILGLLTREKLVWKTVFAKECLQKTKKNDELVTKNFEVPSHLHTEKCAFQKWLSWRQPWRQRYWLIPSVQIQVNRRMVILIKCVSPHNVMYKTHSFKIPRNWIALLLDDIKVKKIGISYSWFKKKELCMGMMCVIHATLTFRFNAIFLSDKNPSIFLCSLLYTC